MRIVLDLTAEESTGPDAAELPNPAGLRVSDLLVTTSTPLPSTVDRPSRGGRSTDGPGRAVLVPDMAAYAHEASEQGLMGAAVARLRRSGPRTVVRVGLVGLGELPSLARMRFASLAKLLVELELASLRKPRPGTVLLAASLTDVAVAAGNRDLFRSFVAFVRRRYRARAGFETWNLGHLLGGLRRWDVSADVALAPVNARGYLMKPDLETCLGEMRLGRVAVWAREVTADGAVDLGQGLEFARSAGASAVVLRRGELGPPSLSRQSGPGG